MRQNRKSWTPQEDQAIQALVKKYSTRRWTIISQKMNQKFPDEGRSGKQCRQRWCNHLNPQINKSAWTQQEIVNLFEAHKKYGNRWREICNVLPGRTDNSIKNQFYCTLRKSLRRIYRLLGTTNSTMKIKKIRPTSLSLMLTNYREQHLLQEQIKNIDIYSIFCQFANDEKYEEYKETQLHIEKKQSLQKILNFLLDYRELSKKNITRNKKRTNKTQRQTLQKNMKPKVGLASSQNKLQQNQQIFNLSQSHENQQENSGKYELQNLEQMDQLFKPINKKQELQKRKRNHQFVKLSEIIQECDQIRQISPLSVKRQNSQLDNVRFMKKDSSLSSQKNLINRISQRQNIQNFSFPFGEPSGLFPALVLKQSYEQYQLKRNQNHELNKSAQIFRNSNILSHSQNTTRQKSYKNSENKVSNIFQGFSHV